MTNSDRQTATLPLAGIVVADFSRVLAGPLCTMMLADAGARVIKVEEPGRGDETRRWGPPFVEGESSYFLSVNRGKESLTINLKSDAGRVVAGRLIEKADVVVENFRLEQKEALGFDPPRIHSLNRRAVLCSVVGFESDGPDAGVPGYDLLAQAAGGFMAITGKPEGEPMKVGVALSDVLTAHYAHGAILSALYARERTGSGAALEVSLFGSTVASLVNIGQSFLLTGEEPRRFGNQHPSIVPYQSFHGGDRPFVVGAGTDQQFDLLCRAVLSDDAMASDERFASNAARVVNRTALIAMLDERFRTAPARQWVERCRQFGIPAAMVEDLGGVFRRAATLIEEIDHPSAGRYRAVGNPVKRDGERRSASMHPPLLGEHNDAVLAWLGFRPEEIERLQAEGAI